MSKPKILVTGAKGQLGTEMVKLLKEMKYEVYGYGRAELDITDFQQVKILLTISNLMSLSTLLLIQK